MTALAVSSYAAAEHKRVCRHESGHAAAGLLLDGIQVRQALAPYRAVPERTLPGTTLGGVHFRGADLRAMALVILAGDLHEGLSPPTWPPLAAASPDRDEGQLAELVGKLGINDKAGFEGLVDEARALCATARFRRIAGVVAAELERHGVLDEEALRAIAAEEDDTMDEFETDAVELDPEAVAFGREFAAELEARMRADRDDALREKALPVARKRIQISVFAAYARDAV